MTALTQDRLRQLLRYEAETGNFFWIANRRPRVKAGDLAGNVTRGVHIGIDQRTYLAHRLAWLYVYGEFPCGDLDHIDGDPTNNRITNLRVCDQQENQQNRSCHGSKRNKSGHSNIYWDKLRRCWQVKFRAYGKNHFGGRFDDIAEAIKARDELKATVHPFQPVYRDLCDALSDSSERREVDRLAAMLRQQVAA